jgi:hypothetical protein
MEVTPHSESRILLATSLTTAVSCMRAAHLTLWDCALTSSAVLFFSVNYWRRPVYGWRRNIDIVNTVTGLFYQLAIAPGVEMALLLPYLAFTACGLACFVLGYQFPGRKATLSHSGVHVFGNVANMFLYPGLAKARGLEPPPVGAGQLAICALVLAAILDVWFVGGWPPRWWSLRKKKNF